MRDFQIIFQHENPLIFSQRELNWFMHTVDGISDKPSDRYD